MFRGRPDNHPAGGIPLGDEPSDDPLNHGPPPNNGFWRSMCNIFANACQKAKNAFRRIYDLIALVLLSIFEAFLDCVHQVEVSLWETFSTFRQWSHGRHYQAF